MGFPNAKASTASEPEQPSRLPSQGRRSFTPDSLKEACRAPSPVPPPSRSATPASTLNGFLAPPNVIGNAKEQGSIALRAIRSVRSLARVGSWAQTGTSENGTKDGTLREKKEKKEKKDKKERKEKKENQDGTVRDKKKAKKEKKEKKERKEKKENEGTLRLSTSSFEAGALTASPERASKTLGKKKSILALGLGLPSSMRLRSGSTASSVIQSTHLSVEGLGIRPKQRMGSTMSTASSLRPISMASSSGASASTRESRGSVKWDEEVLQSGKREIQKDKKEKRKKKKEKGKEEGKDSKRSVEGRRRVSITEVFPEVASSQGHDMDIDRDEDIQKRYSSAFPIVTIEEATMDGHEVDTEDIHDSMVYGGILKEGERIEKEPETTPVKRQRIRPMSEQLLGKARPRAVYEDEEGMYLG